jgi:hypothetical protein
MREFSLPGGVGETIFNYFGADLEIDLELCDQPEHTQPQVESNQLAVRCQRCQQIREIKRPPGILVLCVASPVVRDVLLPSRLPHVR